MYLSSFLKKNQTLKYTLSYRNPKFLNGTSEAHFLVTAQDSGSLTFFLFLCQFLFSNFRFIFDTFVEKQTDTKYLQFLC